jgi:hypothetical protein
MAARKMDAGARRVKSRARAAAVRKAKGGARPASKDGGAQRAYGRKRASYASNKRKGGVVLEDGTMVTGSRASKWNSK